MTTVYREPAVVEKFAEDVETEEHEEEKERGPGSPWPWVILGVLAIEFMIAYFVQFQQSAFVAMGCVDVALVAIVKLIAWAQKIAALGDERKRFERIAYTTLFAMSQHESNKDRGDLKATILAFNKNKLLPEDAEKIAKQVYENKLR